MDSYLKIAILVLFLLTTSILAYVIIEPVMCIWTDLPIDIYQNNLLPLHVKVDQRVKQVWAYNLLPYSDSVIEYGCGNGLTALNIATRNPKNHVLLLDSINQEYIKNLKLDRFDVKIQIESDINNIKDTFNVIIIHQDGQTLFLDHLSKDINIISKARYILFDTSIQYSQSLKPILKAYNFNKQKTYINLSIWYKDVA